MVTHRQTPSPEPFKKVNHMASSKRVRNFPGRSWRDGEAGEEESPLTMFEVYQGRSREKIVLQRLIYTFDHITGLLLIYPSVLLHVIESSRDVLLSVLKDLKDLQQETDCALLEAPKVVFMAHNPESRLFQQWSYKVLNVDQKPGDAEAKEQEEEEDSTETLVCTVLSALQKLGEHLETSKKADRGSVLDETPGLVISQAVLEKLLARADFLTPQEHLQMYDSPLNISMDCGQVIRSSFHTTV
ncbi:Testis-expressed protein 47 [Larimichthys crocea]|uniref:Testis-expressed protein 47 n=1 Tax=Larimichthys crocea TaxID=215358 RepID=A0A6G0HXI8_LARCR|nr:Testis-expressed protein 47 [Larimichthys crocea]